VFVKVEDGKGRGKRWMGRKIREERKDF